MCCHQLDSYAWMLINWLYTYAISTKITAHDRYNHVLSPTQWIWTAEKTLKIPISPHSDLYLNDWKQWMVVFFQGCTAILFLRYATWCKSYLWHGATYLSRRKMEVSSHCYIGHCSARMIGLIWIVNILHRFKDSSYDKAHNYQNIFINTFEPGHWISNNVVYATSKASDQPVHTRRLIRAFASCLKFLWVLSYWLNIISCF